MGGMSEMAWLAENSYVERARVRNQEVLGVNYSTDFKYSRAKDNRD